MSTVLGEVRLAVPATPAFLRLARLTAASLASRMGFTYDEVEDLRIAIDEMCFTLVGSKGRDGVLILTYSMLPEGLSVVGTAQLAEEGRRPTLSPLSSQILKAVVDQHDLRAQDGIPGFRLLKRHATV